MLYRNTAILYSFALFLSLFVWILQEILPAPSFQKEEKKDLVFPSLSGANLKELVLSRGKYRLSLQRGSSGWHSSYCIGNNIVIEDQADELQMKELISELVSLKTEKMTERKQESDWEKYGLGSLSRSSSDSIQVIYGNMAHRLSLGFVLEKSNVLQVYARLDDQNRLLVLNGKILRWTRNIHENPDAMRSRKVFSLKEIPEKIFWQNRQGEKIVLFKEKEEWYLEGEQKDRANPHILEKLIQWMKQTTIQRFLYDHKPDIKNLGPFSILGYQGEKREEYFLLGKRIQNDSPDAFYYCARAFLQDKELKVAYHYLISIKSGEELPLEINDFRDTKILRFPQEKLEKIFRKGKISWSLERENGIWKLTFPRSKEIQLQKVQEFIESLSCLSSSKFFLSKREKENPEKLTLFWEKGKKQSLHWYILSEKEIVVYQEGDTIGRILSLQGKNPLNQNHFFFYNNRIDAFSFSQVYAITIQKQGKSYELKKKEENWWLCSPVNALVNKDHVEDILRNGAWIMAQSVLGEGEEARKEYECGKEYRLEIQSFEKKSCWIEPGKEVEKGFYSLWVSGFPYVYKISDSLIKIIQKELIEK